MKFQFLEFACIILTDLCEPGELLEVLGSKRTAVELDILSPLVVADDELVEPKDQLIACEATSTCTLILCRHPYHCSLA